MNIQNVSFPFLIVVIFFLAFVSTSHASSITPRASQLLIADQQPTEEDVDEKEIEIDTLTRLYPDTNTEEHMKYNMSSSLINIDFLIPTKRI